MRFFCCCTKVNQAKSLVNQSLSEQSSQGDYQTIQRIEDVSRSQAGNVIFESINVKIIRDHQLTGSSVIKKIAKTPISKQQLYHELIILMHLKRNISPLIINFIGYSNSLGDISSISFEDTGDADDLFNCMLPQSKFHSLVLEYRHMLMRQCAEAISFCVSRGVVHHDIKPENILCTFTNGIAGIKLIDFGLSRLLSDRPCYAGTIGYRAPEILNGKGAKDTTDIWSLFVVFAIMLAGANIDVLEPGTGFRTERAAHKRFYTDPESHLKNVLSPYGVSDRDWWVNVLKSMSQENPQQRISAETLVTTLENRFTAAV